MRKIKLAFAFAATVLGLGLLAPPGAYAGTASVVDGKLVFKGGDQADEISVGTWDPSSEPELMYEVLGRNRPVAAGPGCKKISSADGGFPDAAYCPRSVTSILVLTLGGGDDVGMGVLNPSTPDGGIYVNDPITISLGDGNDSASSATSGPRATLLGGPGKDVLNGQGFDGEKNPVTARGGGGADNIIGGCAKRDKLFGDGGGDSFQAIDGLNDIVNGGPGSDTGYVDRNIDTRISIEESVFGKRYSRC